MSWWRSPADDFRVGHAATVAVQAFKNGRTASAGPAILCQVGDALALTRPPGWADRSRRAYLGAIRRLDRRLAAAAPADRCPVAHAVLREARRPYRRLAAVLARRAALGFVGLAALALVASAVSPAARAWLFPPDSAPSHRGRRAAPPPAACCRYVHPLERRVLHAHGFAGSPVGPDHAAAPGEGARGADWNRSDCCQERTIPLNVEVPDGNGWRLLCQRRSPFSSSARHQVARGHQADPDRGSPDDDVSPCAGRDLQ